MKKLITTLAIAIMFLGANAQTDDDPPHPNGDVNPTQAGSGNSPVGGGAPIGSGITFMLVLGAGYGMKRIYNAKIRKLND